MQNTPLLLNPKEYVHHRVIVHQERVIRVATEIFLAEKCTRVHYADLMDDVPNGTASKNSLISWLNDNTRKGQLIRKGIISLYKEEKPGHFEGNAWNSLCFAQFVEYALKKLTDKSFVKNRNTANLYAKSIKSADWVGKAAAVMGLKLLEELHSLNKLTSVVAKTLLDLNANNRDLLSKNGSIIGRVAKNNRLDGDFTQEMKGIFEGYYKKQWQLEIKKHSQHEEYKLLEEYKPDIEAALVGATMNLIEGE